MNTDFCASFFGIQASQRTEEMGRSDALAHATRHMLVHYQDPLESLFSMPRLFQDKKRLALKVKFMLYNSNS